MAVQWDSENGLSGWGIKIINTFRGVNNELPSISDDIVKYFNEIKKAVPTLGDGQTVVGWDYFNEKLKMTDKNVLKFQEDWNGVGDISEAFQQWMKKNTQSLTLFQRAGKAAGNAIKSIGAAIGSMAAAWAIGEVLSAVA